MDIVAVIAENKIREAIKKGELQNLSGKGKPLKLDDLSGVPEELRASYIILKNHGVLPPELELEREIVTLKKLVNCCYHDEEKTALQKKLNEKMLRFNLLMEKRGMSAALRFYKDKIDRKLEK
ncbi:DUF1992 domain-containing protein [Desulfallas sp. Bu1-1]|uniref:DnaJ family domain-containing protein n=1 Tax=Desulfallas sp. Bu1-1 TaxID=2787620 RepID=UPI00189FBDC4|nr:DnaJ family domain-containing protein [Desulfallas sp. Bu1-1]MBF7084576.1 DUF1992 domain-containing protein [Desulfallas sp. Bu1-1]